MTIRATLPLSAGQSMTPSQSTRRKRVRAARDGDSAVHTIDASAAMIFDDFYAANIAKLSGALGATLRNPDLGQEAAQEAMVRACERWDTVSEHANPMGWCYRVGMNWATSRWRKLRRETGLRDGHLATMVGGEITLGNDALQHALLKLPVDQRSVVVLRYWMGWKNEEIATALDIPPGTVSSRMSRALDALKVHAKDAR